MTDIDRLAATYDAQAQRPHLQLPTPAAVVSAPMGRRRRMGLFAAGLVAAALVAGSAAAFAFLDRDPGVGSVGLAGPAPTLVAPILPAKASPGGSRTPATPDGRIPPRQLGQATITVPAWRVGHDGCASGRLRFVAGRYTGKVTVGDQGLIRIAKVVYADLDDDLAMETAALLTCVAGEGYDAQVLAFDRDSSGAIVTLGPVVHTSKDVQLILDVAASPSGGVRVNLGDLQVCCGDAAENTQTQWRIYGWDGAGYARIGGPTAFPPNRYQTDLILTVGDLVFGPSEQGRRHGVLTLTVRNSGPVRSDAQDIMIALPAGARAGNGWTSCTPILDGHGQCEHGLLGVGQTFTLHLGMILDAGVALDASLPLWVNAINVNSKTGGARLDATPANNRLTYHVQLL